MDWRTLRALAWAEREKDELAQLHELDLGGAHKWEYCAYDECTSARHYHCERCGDMQSFDDDGWLI